MRVLFFAAGWLLPFGALAWDTTPHQIITKAALDHLPSNVRQRFGAEVSPLVEIYCIYPDRFQEMERFGFVRKSPGPRTASEIRVYCMRPNGELVHGATGDRDADLASLVFLFERIEASLSTGDSGEAAKYAGVLSHFIADSLSPPHAVSPEDLRDMVPWYTACGRVELHSAIERSLPVFRLDGRTPRAVGATPRAAAQAILALCYAGAEANRRDLPAMVKAACAGDQRSLDTFRIRAGSGAAAILADALYTLATPGR
jgi:hypothetical protein